MKFVIALALFAFLALTEARYMSSCDAECDLDLYGEFPMCMSDGSVVCGWCAAKQINCDTSNSVRTVLGNGERVRICRQDWKAKGNCKDQ